MKKTILTLAVVAFMAGTVSTLNAQTTDKQSDKARENLKDAKEDVIDAKKELREAKRDSVSDYQAFKAESNLKIKDNEKRIAELKVKHAKVNKKNKASYNKDVNALEQKNNNLKVKLAEYKESDHSAWQSFKLEFNHDMNELGTALSDFVVNNK